MKNNPNSVPRFMILTVIGLFVAPLFVLPVSSDEKYTEQVIASEQKAVVGKVGEVDKLPNQSIKVSPESIRVETLEQGYTSVAPPPPPEVLPAMIHNKQPTFFNDVKWALQWPFPVGVPVSGVYGPRIAPCAGCSSNHKGVDFTPGYGSPTQVIYPGVVKSVKNSGNSGLGYNVIIGHVIDGENVDTVYGHMITDSSELKVGDLVKTGDKVGLVGNTGSSTGAHLHFEVRVEGIQVNPFAWMSKHAGVVQ
jgi:murein DD-endopeptidase MepM/ murein hydrolase activator NlpD